MRTHQRRVNPCFAGTIAAGLLFAAAAAASGHSSKQPFDTLEERIATPSFDDPLAGADGGPIIVLTTYNKTNFFIDEQGEYRGFEYDILKGYESFVNKHTAKRSKRRYLVFVPMQFEAILPALADGRGDIAAANLTVTEQRSRIVDFAAPYLPNVNEVVVARKGGPAVASVDDLAGHSIYVLAGSSYIDHLKALNDRLVNKGLERINIIEAAPSLDHADIFQLVESGAVDFTVADNHIANVWAPIFDKLVVRSDLVINRGGKIAWAIRKNTPKFKASVNAYVRSIKKGTLKGNIAFNDYYKSRRWIRSPLDDTELAKLNKIVHHIKHYARQYSMDWIAIAAQAYQESQLDQSKVSPAGAIGIMQLLPETAARKPIEIKNIKKVENNIHAGVKYLRFIRDHYFDDPDISPTAQKDFSWAAYNAGPTRIQELRKRAAVRGYDPNKWFGNVEHVASETIGHETVDYVANINKYYIAYKFGFQDQKRREAQLKSQVERANDEKALEAWKRSQKRQRQ